MSNPKVLNTVTKVNAYIDLADNAVVVVISGVSLIFIGMTGRCKNRTLVALTGSMFGFSVAGACYFGVNFNRTF